MLNDGRYGHALFDGAVRVSLARAARYPDPDADQGRHEVTVSLFPHGAGPGRRGRRGRAARPAGARRSTAAPASTRAGAASSTVTGAGVEVDAVKLADDGSGDLVVRLHEACGDRARVTVRVRPAGSSPPAAATCSRSRHAGFEVSDGIVAAHPAPVRAGHPAPDPLTAAPRHW